MAEVVLADKLLLLVVNKSLQRVYDEKIVNTTSWNLFLRVVLGV